MPRGIAAAGVRLRRSGGRFSGRALTVFDSVGKVVGYRKRQPLFLFMTCFLLELLVELLAEAIKTFCDAVTLGGGYPGERSLQERARFER